MSTNAFGRQASSRSAAWNSGSLDRYDRLHTLDVTLTDLRTEPAVEGSSLTLRDVSDNKELERSLRHQALHGALTGLPESGGLRECHRG